MICVEMGGRSDSHRNLDGHPRRRGIRQLDSGAGAVGGARPGRPTVTVIHPDGTTVPNPPSRWPHRATVAASHPAVARVLRITARNDDLDWYDLYKIHEITKAQDRAFTVSADRYEVSGFAGMNVAFPRRTDAKAPISSRKWEPLRLLAELSARGRGGRGPRPPRPASRQSRSRWSAPSGPPMRR